MYATSANRAERYATHLEGYDWHETKPTQAP
jgi:hypothetical protein